MAEQARFHVLSLEWLAEQRIVEEVNLSDGKIVGGSPIGVHFLELLGGKRTCRFGLAVTSRPPLRFGARAGHCLISLFQIPQLGNDQTGCAAWWNSMMA